nr:recombinase [Alysiella crassa]UOP07245.1 recombinase [Alysiella crassa]
MFFKTNRLPEIVQQRVAEQDAYHLLKDLADHLRRAKPKRAPEQIEELITLFRQNPELCQKTATLLVRWLCGVRLYPLFISAGIFSRDGFRSELLARWYEKINPSYKDRGDLRDVFSQIFSSEYDGEWLDAISPHTWFTLLHLLRQHTSEHDRETVNRYLRQEGFHAVEMLSIWVAAEELEPDLIRLDKKLLDRDSPFVAMKREVAHWLEAREQDREFDDSHLDVMLNQCRKQVDNLRKKGTGAGAGSSMGVAHLLERLEQTLNRMTLLMNVFSPKEIAPSQMLRLTYTLAHAAAAQHSVSWLWKRSVKMLSRSITQNTSNRGEHYITRNQKEYMNLLRSAAGGGVLIALMSWFKIYLGSVITNQFWLGIAEGLNYGVGFAVIYMLGFTVATKQPAMTASRFAAAVERNDKGIAVNKKLANLLVDVLRSQTAAVLGNVLVAVSLASVIAGCFLAFSDFPMLNKAQVQYQLKAIDPLKPTLLYAAIAGVWLFCSGIISGFFDNRCDYLNMRMRMRYRPVLKMLLPEQWRGKFADYLHDNYGALMGNLCFGMLLGMTGFIGHATGLPLDIRHVAFSSANVGYAAVSGSLSFWVFLQSLVFVMMIGAVNLWVSFSITLWVALRSRETRIESWWAIFREVKTIAKERPLSLFLPMQLPPEPASPQPKKVEQKKEETAQSPQNDIN